MPADRVLPRPLEIHAGASPTGLVDLDPPLSWLELTPGQGVQLELTLDNGAEHPVSYHLAVSPVAPGPDGAPVVRNDAPVVRPDDAPVVRPDDAPIASARDWLQLADRAVRLGPGDRALLWPAVIVPP
ncbi:MAG TPA: hypothetical protein VHF25_14345, partial [Nitriliruptorales bacterium]|nr:hypothetical protein [Nitriliruptorales bacterium]